MQQWRILLYVFHLHASVLISDSSMYSTHTHTHTFVACEQTAHCAFTSRRHHSAHKSHGLDVMLHTTLCLLVVKCENTHTHTHTHTKTHTVIATVIFVKVQRGPDSIWATGCVCSGSENRSIHPKSLNHSVKNLWSAKMFLTETEQERKCEYLHYEIALAVPCS